MNSKLQIVSSMVLLLGAANCHKDVKVTDTGPKCNIDSDCATGSLCHPTRKMCLQTYPDQRLLDASYELKGCTPANIYFAFDSAELTPDTKQWLKYDVRCIKSQTKTVVIDGYSDAKGEPGYNVTLSDKRAQTVKQFFDQNGVTTAEIAAKGEKNPITTGTTEQDYAWNRRVEIRF